MKMKIIFSPLIRIAAGRGGNGLYHLIYGHSVLKRLICRCSGNMAKRGLKFRLSYNVSKDGKPRFLRMS